MYSTRFYFQVLNSLNGVIEEAVLDLIQMVVDEINKTFKLHNENKLDLPSILKYIEDIKEMDEQAGDF